MNLCGTLRVAQFSLRWSYLITGKKHLNTNANLNKTRMAQLLSDKNDYVGFDHILPDGVLTTVLPFIPKLNVPVTEAKEVRSILDKISQNSLSGKGNLPIYLQKRQMYDVTILRKTSGDLDTLLAELRILCESRVTRYDNLFEIRGSHKTLLRAWAESLGF